MSKFIFVTGGVVSGLGKGVVASSIGRLLKSRGYSIFVQKLDPYLNLDAGTMSPYEHGEVFVTKDGGETDLDLGHYERFIGTKFTKDSNFTSGQIYNKIINREREGFYGGKTIQIIPHVTDYIEEIILKSEEKSKADFIITEVGGTIGDIESQPFIYTLANLLNKHKEKCFLIHTSYIPFLNASKEFKSKPTQHSVKELRKYGINPNMIVLRSNFPITDKIIAKTSFSALLKKEAIVGLSDSKSIYEIPLLLEEKNVVQKITNYFNLKDKKAELDNWKRFVKLINAKDKKELNIAMIGKYTTFKDAYYSIIEALKVSAIYKNCKINLKWVQSSKITKENIKNTVKDVDGVLILPGFGKRGFEGKVIAAEYLRNLDIPTFGICYGMQAMTIAWAKKCGYKDAISTENDKVGTPIVDIIRDKKYNDNLGGTLRLGEHETIIDKNTLVYQMYKKSKILERHRHRYEINPKFKDELEKDGFVFCGKNIKNNLAEIVEYNKHPFYIGVQFHPEFNSNPLKEHPLFKEFIKKTIIKKSTS